MDILEKRELDNMKLFYEYLGLETCPTSFAIASGLLYFRDSNNILRSSYFVNDTNESNYREIAIVDDKGDYAFKSKLDKFIPGIRIGMKKEELDDNLLYDSMVVNKDISVIEYGCFPKGRINRVYEKADTGLKIKLPTSKYAYSVPQYVDFPVLRNLRDDTYFIEYPINSMTTIENKDFIPGEIGCFKIEPIRFWVDNTSNILLSQDVIMGGVPYKMSEINAGYEYDDYYDSDVYNAVQIIEEDIKILNNLVKSSEKDKKR